MKFIASIAIIACATPTLMASPAMLGTMVTNFVSGYMPSLPSIPCVSCVITDGIKASLPAGVYTETPAERKLKQRQAMYAKPSKKY